MTFALSRRLRRIAVFPLMAVAVAIVLVDDGFRAVVGPSVRGLAKLGFVRRLEAAIARLPPYGILTLFLVPLAVIEPLKLYGLYLFGAGRFLSGLLVFCIAKVVGLGLAERLFAVGRAKLLSIGWFAWCHGWILWIRNRVHDWLKTTRFWRRAMLFAAAVRRMAARGIMAEAMIVRAILIPSQSGRFAAARRRVRRWLTA